jgi:ABC-2 type transport system permease protein
MAVTTAFWMVFTGVVIPRDTLPAGLYEVSEVMPMTHALQGIREAFDGASLGAMSDHLMLELLVGACYAIFGYMLFRVIERYARSSGAYDASEV